MKNYSESKIENILKFIKPHLNGKILDIGCNEGIVAEKLGMKDFDYLGIDADKDALLKAKNKKFNVKKIDLNEEKIPFRDEIFDTIICLDVLEHLLDPVKIMHQINALLKNDGVAIICLPNDLNLINMLKACLLNRPIVAREWMWKPYGHLHFPSINESKKIIDKNFRIKEYKFFANNLTVPIFPNKIKGILANTCPHWFAKSGVFIVGKKTEAIQISKQNN